MWLKDVLRVGFFVTCWLICFSAEAKIQDRGYVLVLNSYTDFSTWSNYAIDSLLKDKSFKGDVRVESLNVLLIDDEKGAQERRDLVLAKYQSKPECIVVLGNSALCIFREFFDGIWKDVPVVLCSQISYVSPLNVIYQKNEITSNDIIPLNEVLNGMNVTRIQCPIYIKETIGEMKLLLPNMEKIVLISDGRYVSAQVRYNMKQVCEEFFPDLEVSNLIEGKVSIDSVLDSIYSYDIAKVGILYYSWIQREVLAGNRYVSSNFHKTISNFDEHPIFTLEDMDVANKDVAGGYFYLGKDFGHTVASTVREILGGRAAREIPEQLAGDPGYYLCYPILQKAGIPESLYPRNATYVLAPESFWMKSRYMLLTIAVLLLMTYLMWLRVRLLKKERSLRDREFSMLHKYKALFTHMPLAYMKHRLIYNTRGEVVNYQVEEVNPMFEKCFASSDIIVGKRGNELSNGRNEEFIVLYKKMLVGKKSFTIEYYHKPTQKYYEVLCITSMEKGMVDVFCIDVTDLRETKSLLESVNYKLALALDVACITPWRWDLEKKTMLCDVNRSLELKYKGDDEDSLSVPEEQYFSKIHKDDRRGVRDAYSTLIAGKVDKIKVEYRVLDHSDHHYSYEWVEAQATVDQRDANGKPLSLIGSSVTTTGRKKMELALLEAKEHAEESNRLKSAFLANMSHEIRTPLNAIVGFSNILASAEAEEEKQEYINIIENNNTLLLQLISDILDLSKIESGSMEFAYSEFDLNAMLHELEQSSRLRLTSSAVIICLDECLPECCIRSERNRLTQVITNLVTNAIKFTEKGSIRFGYHLLEKNSLYFYVSDTGCGIEVDKKDSVFDRFVKLDSFAQGTGLGLSICKTIVERMGGKIGVESEVGKGTTFWFTIPYTAVKLLRVEVEKEKTVQQVVEKSKLKILVAEDNPSNYMLFESVLKKDYNLVHAWNGLEAVELFKKHEPHLVLMDINMPELNGFQAVQEIRKLSDSVPVIAVTAYAYASDEDKIMASGFDAYTAKPINANQLKNKIISLLEKHLILL